MNKLAISCYLDHHIDFYSTKEGVDPRGEVYAIGIPLCPWILVQTIRFLFMPYGLCQVV
jgi:hypothetical protein